MRRITFLKCKNYWHGTRTRGSSNTMRSQWAFKNDLGCWGTARNPRFLAQNLKIAIGLRQGFAFFDKNAEITPEKRGKNFDTSKRTPPVKPNFSRAVDTEF